MEKKKLEGKEKIFTRQMLILPVMVLISLAYGISYQIMGERSFDNLRIFAIMILCVVVVITISYYFLLVEKSPARKVKLIAAKMRKIGVVFGFGVFALGIFLCNYAVKSGADLYSWNLVWGGAVAIAVGGLHTTAFYYRRRRTRDLSAILWFMYIGFVASLMMPGIVILINGR